MITLITNHIRMKNKNLWMLLAIALLVVACGPSQKQEEASEEDQMLNDDAIPIVLTKAPTSPAYEDAELNMESLDVTKEGDKFIANLNFDVINYELGVQTEGSDTRGIANSAKGQHIHFIINNGPYSAHYEPEFSKEMEEGNYVLLAFLSRSYHESVKNPNAFWVDKVVIGEPTEELEVDFTQPHMFYSRPKGTYTGEDTKNVMIDFYLLNVNLSPDGNKVRATINDQEFIIDEYAPHYASNMPMGENTIKLELIDNEGNLIPGPFNSVTRTVNLEEGL
jgi:hypothetical protein